MSSENCSDRDCYILYEFHKSEITKNFIYTDDHCDRVFFSELTGWAITAYVFIINNFLLFTFNCAISQTYFLLIHIIIWFYGSECQSDML